MLVCLILLWVARRFADSLKNGDMSVLYVSLYSFGRFFVEALRVDPAFLIGGTIRGNLFVSSVLALGFAMILLLRHSGQRRKRPESSYGGRIGASEALGPWSCFSYMALILEYHASTC